MTFTEGSPTKLLLADHKRIRGLFRQTMVLDQRAHEMMPGLSEELFLELEIHGTIQHECTNPALMNVMEPDGRGQVMKSEDRFREISELIGELKKLSLEAESYQQKMADLRKTTELLFEEEEHFIHPEIENLPDDLLVQLTSEMKALRERILNDPRNQSARAYYVQNPNGGEHKRKLAA
ncbi:MAG TPA: hypothetical protein DCS07_10095 [Bdellovibrionales bacterium]|nr:MAG: hypothetical protein A2Z97_01425 [Bdellovibrionales bacterium GWB1_52_6]OFZ04993.1 MAG: hypothetical protein A2X97_00135 [Bdellovibrionales bacterium GWA1_52_35]OFZ40303.1 MAG: hypothetical protein A2070_10950 [Bdellovibrionales bacterium GWC1_52_8]HAR42962.1 hypothetical protein [Bdellovibrionales bacterium]HCM41223.1 hypothetical protein [Bdellovibrionales bacterium]